jgi:hypothetical protein
MATTEIPVSRLRIPSSSRYTTRSSDFLALMKPRVMSLSVLTALVGLLIAPGHLDPLYGSIAIFAIAAGAGAAGALNMLALAFGVLIVFLVITGSLWIMTNLNENMIPSSELMSLRLTTTNQVKQELADERSARPTSCGTIRAAVIPRPDNVGALTRTGAYRAAYLE